MPPPALTQRRAGHRPLLDWAGRIEDVLRGFEAVRNAHRDPLGAVELLDCAGRAWVDVCPAVPPLGERHCPQPASGPFAAFFALARPLLERLLAVHRDRMAQPRPGPPAWVNASPRDANRAGPPLSGDFISAWKGPPLMTDTRPSRRTVALVVGAVLIIVGGVIAAFAVFGGSGSTGPTRPPAASRPATSQPPTCRPRCRPSPVRRPAASPRTCPPMRGALADNALDALVVCAVGVSRTGRVSLSWISAGSDVPLRRAFMSLYRAAGGAPRGTERSSWLTTVKSQRSCSKRGMCCPRRTSSPATVQMSAPANAGSGRARAISRIIRCTPLVEGQFAVAVGHLMGGVLRCVFLEAVRRE